MDERVLEDGYALLVAWQDGSWVVRTFEDSFTTLSTSIRSVRSLRSEGASFAILNVEEDYLVIVRPGPTRTQVLISDVTMAVDDAFAAEAAEEAGVDIPDIDPAELDNVDGYADGDFGIFSDVGMSEELMGILLDPDEEPHVIIEEIASRLGFSDELDRALE